MYIYNVTTSIDEDVSADWVQWMKTEHMAAMLATGCFTKSRLCRIIADDPNGKTYAAQYKFPNLSAFHQYQTKFAAVLQAKVKERYDGKYATFATVMQIL